MDECVYVTCVRYLNPGPPAVPERCSFTTSCLKCTNIIVSFQDPAHKGVLVLMPSDTVERIWHNDVFREHLFTMGLLWLMCQLWFIPFKHQQNLMHVSMSAVYGVCSVVCMMWLYGLSSSNCFLCILCRLWCRCVKIGDASKRWCQDGLWGWLITTPYDCVVVIPSCLRGC